MTMRLDGGMVGPMMEPATTTAQAKGCGYPALTMAGTMVLPKAAVSATAAPVMPAKMTEATMLECASPPRKWPTRALAKPVSRSVMPERFMISPARMKKGMAMKVYRSRPW